MQKSERIALIATVAVALIVRLASIYEYGPSVIKFGDAPGYLSAATSLCHTASYPDRGSMPFFRAPGLPFFIMAATLCHTEMVWLVKAALAVVDCLSVALVFLLAEELFRDRRLSLFSATGAAIYPFFVAQVCDVQTEGLFMFLFLASIWLTLRAVRSPNPYFTLAAGLCAGAAALVRPVGLVLLPPALGDPCVSWSGKKEPSDTPAYLVHNRGGYRPRSLGRPEWIAVSRVYSRQRRGWLQLLEGDEP